MALYRKKEPKMPDITAQDLIINNPEYEKYYVIDIVDPAQKRLPVDMWSYAMYYYSNIQKKEISSDLQFIDGLRLDKYMKYYCEEKGINNFENYLQEISCYDIISEMNNKHSVHINIFALYGLCMYVREIINRRLCFLLKPTEKELLTEIGDVNNLKNITFSTFDNKKIETNNSSIKEALISILNKREDNIYEFDHIAKATDVFSKEYGQVEFVRAISQFFQRYFKIKRRENCVISITEQRIISFLLYFFGFSPEPVQETRIRQLLNSKMNICDSLFFLSSIPLFKNSSAAINIEFIPFSVWKNGRINAMNYKPMVLLSPTNKCSFTISMGNDKEKITELIREIGVAIRDCFTLN